MPEADAAEPFVTIIMPIRNEARFIKRSLGGVLAQDYPLERMEVLVVDGMSDDGTREVIQGLISAPQNGNSGCGPEQPDADKLRRAIRMLDNPSRIVPAALNIGLQHARGEFIFRLDGHSEMAPDYVRRCVAKLQERPDVACVAGPSVAVGSSWVGEAYALALQSPFGVGGGTFRTLRSESYVDTLAFGGYRRKVFDELGEFDTTLQRNQDIEFSARITKAGYPMLLIPDTETFYHAPERLGGILRQNYNNGYWNTKVLDRMIGVLSWRHFVPALFVASLLISVVAALAHPVGRILLLLVAGSYLLVSFLASVSIALRYRRRGVLLLPFLFPLMHISYGLGSLAGLCEYMFIAGLRFKQR